MRLPALLLPLALATVMAGGATPAEATGSLQLGKINYNAAGSDTTSNVNGEYVVIKNLASTSKCLTGWKVKDAAGHTYTFGTFCLAGYKSVYLYTGKGTNSSTRRYWGMGWHVWNNTGDTAYLRTSAGTSMDTCTWGSGGVGYVYC
jgi:hypothetical protein